VKFASIAEVRLLLVDDEKGFREALARRLGKKVAAVWDVDDGQSCLDFLEKTPVDVIVMDVRMPGMDGIETLEAVQSRHQQIETILLTGQANTTDGVRGIKAGAFDYLGKPIDFDHLMLKIGQAYQKIKQEEAERSNEQYKEKMEQQLIATERLAALGTLAAGVAHEINNPLAIINEAAAVIKLLLSKEELIEIPHKEKLDRALNKILTGVERAKKITHQLLGSAREIDTIICEVDFADIVHEAVSLVRKEAGRKEIAIETDIDATVPVLWTDPNQIRQILINLLTNAIQASESQGLINIRTRKASKGILLSVIDSGTGIPKNDIDRIFEPFFSTKTPNQGTGLGLYVTKEIVTRLGGTIEVDSRVGEGTRFDVSLPDKRGLTGDQQSDSCKPVSF
jgi:signal transduction histidine kinase